MRKPTAPQRARITRASESADPNAIRTSVYLPADLHRRLFMAVQAVRRSRAPGSGRYTTSQMIVEACERYVAERKIA